MTALDTEPFWSEHQPGFRLTSHEPGSSEFFDAVERHRYRLEPHIPSIVQFQRWHDRDVLEVGCGIATDGINFARAGARYVGVDQSSHALELARRRFELHQVPGTLTESKAGRLPFADASFDLVFSHGVIHHMEDPEAAVAELHRVLRPGGTALCMVYHRNSLNYLFTIMILRRLLAGLLLIPGTPGLVARITKESSWVLARQRCLLKTHGLRYLVDGSLFLSNNTDGPGNPLSRVYSRRELSTLFHQFASAKTQVRFLNLRIYPMGDRLARTRLSKRLERRVGWHLYIQAIK